MRIFLAALLSAAALPAHDPGLSSATLRLARGRASLEFCFNGADLASIAHWDRDRNGRLDASEIVAARDDLLAWVRAGVALHCRGVALAAAVGGEALACANGDVLLRLSFDNVPEAEAATLALPLLQQFARGHRQYAVAFAPTGSKLAEALLRPDQATFTFALAGIEAGIWSKATEFFGLGVEHILTGFDHLTFLLGLLLVAGSLRRVAVLITSFTLAHSLTLGMATLDLLRPPGAVVEAVIALSIVWIGIENLITREPRRRWLTTFGFGLVHGFGFATALQELGIAGSAGVAVPLLSFNLGVECGQLAVAALLLPLFWWCARRPALHRRLVPVLSVAVSAAGAFWLAERTLL